MSNDELYKKDMDKNNAYVQNHKTFVNNQVYY